MGAKEKVYALDIHPLAVKKVRELAAKTIVDRASRLG